MIAELRQRREKLQGYLAALDTVIAFETDINALRIDGSAQTEKTKALAEYAAENNGGTEVASKAVTKTARVVSRTKLHRPAKAQVPRGSKPGTVSAAIRTLFAGTTETLTAQDVRKRLRTSNPELGDKVDSASVYLIDMATHGELRRDGAGVTAAYTRTSKLQAVRAAAKSPKEAAYQEFRSTVPMPAPVEA